MTVLVLGMGSSGKAMADALVATGEDVKAADERMDLDLSGIQVPVQLGTLSADLLSGVATVVTSPGIPPSKPVLAAAERRGIPIWSEPELAWRLNAGRTKLIAVTGTNGKTTTTQMIAACLDVPAAGNIGPVLVTALTVEPPPLVVVELSSFQLHYTQTLRPDVAVLVNVADDHLDWHGGAAGYRAAKAKIWRQQRSDDMVVVNADDAGAMAIVAAFPPPGRVAETAAADDLLDPAAMRAPGPHNLLNATLAARASMAAGATLPDVRDRLHAFDVGDHRLQVIADVAGVVYVNDSKATNPHAALAALESFSDIVWIAGGLNKGLSFDLLKSAAASRVRHVLTIGQCGPEVARMAAEAGVEVTQAQTLERAVPLARDIAARAVATAPAGRQVTVLLAPAAASMDQFHNYAERGSVFITLVRDLQGTTT